MDELDEIDEQAMLDYLNGKTQPIGHESNYHENYLHEVTRTGKDSA